MKRRDFAIVSTQGTYSASGVIAQPETVFHRYPSVGLSIGTFAALPYIHLQLEARRRFYPALPVLVHDDASPAQEDLRRLCDRYGCEFETNSSRQPPGIGDISCFLGGLLWAERNGFDILVKMSRRFIPLMDWVPSLQALAFSSQYPTFCSHTETFNYGFRTECVGMAVRAWMTHRMHSELALVALSSETPFVEGVIHDFARRLALFRCAHARCWDDQIGPRPLERDGYAPWDFMGVDRTTRYPHFLWHDSVGPRAYYQLAVSWGLEYTEADFVDPNQGVGDPV